MRKGCDGPSKIILQFLAIEPHFACKGCDWHLKIAILPQFLMSISCERVAMGQVKSQFYCSFWRPTSISCERVAMGQVKSQFYCSFLTSNVHFVRWILQIKSKFCLSFWRPTSISCERVAMHGYFKVAILPQFLTSNVHFVRKGCDGQSKIAMLPQFLTSNVHFVRKGCGWLTTIAILPRFWTSNVHFVRKGCVSWRSGGTAPALRER